MIFKIKIIIIKTMRNRVEIQSKSKISKIIPIRDAVMVKGIINPRPHSKILVIRLYSLMPENLSHFSSISVNIWCTTGTKSLKYSFVKLFRSYSQALLLKKQKQKAFIFPPLDIYVFLDLVTLI